MTEYESLSWYEASLPMRERKIRGHFSTPPQLVEQILDTCGYRPEHDLSHLRVLDPACGSGNFLAGAIRRLVASGQQKQIEPQHLLRAVQHNIWGFDPDPVACFLAEMRLRAALEETWSGELISQGRQPTLQVHQADGLAFPWGTGEQFDLFLANPPYLAMKNTDLSGYRLAQRRGQTDSYLLFLDLALQVVRPGGWIGLVLPDPVLARLNAARERRRLLQETTVHALWHLSGVFAAHVGAVAIVAQKHPVSPGHIIAWNRRRWPGSEERKDEQESRLRPDSRTGSSLQRAGEGKIEQSVLALQPGAELRYLLSEVQGKLVEQLHQYLCTDPLHEKQGAFVTLGELVTIRRGEELGKECALLTGASGETAQGWYPVLRGGIDIRAYESPVGERWIEQKDIKKTLARYLETKLLAVKSSGRLQVTLDKGGHVVLQTLYMLHLRNREDEDTYYFLLALLNSRLLAEYVYVLYTAYKWVQPQLEQHVLASLPVPALPSEERDGIIKRAKWLLHACREKSPVVELKEQEIARERTDGSQLEERRHLWLEEQERAICSLYDSALRQAATQESALLCNDKGVRIYG